MAGRKPSQERAELYRLREFGKKVQKMKRQDERRVKLAGRVSVGGRS